MGKGTPITLPLYYQHMFLLWLPYQIAYILDRTTEKKGLIMLVLWTRQRNEGHDILVCKQTTVCIQYRHTHTWSLKFGQCSVKTRLHINWYFIVFNKVQTRPPFLVPDITFNIHPRRLEKIQNKLF